MLLSLIGAVLIGLSLGLMGSGGSIFTVPILHYGLGWDEKLAVCGSLFVVGSISLLAAVPQAFAGRVRWKSVALFGVPGVCGTWAGAYLSRWVPGSLQLGLFAGVMLVAAFFMRRPAKPHGEPGGGNAAQARRHAWKMAADGLGVGVLTGLVGVGGGFMIVPALVLLGGLEMHAAIGTSLAIIAAKSFAGFGGYLPVLRELDLQLDWRVLSIFVGLGTVGSLLGGRLGALVREEQLKRAFSGVLLVMAVAILIAETVGPGDEPGALDVTDTARTEARQTSPHQTSP